MVEVEGWEEGVCLALNCLDDIFNTRRGCLGGGVQRPLVYCNVDFKALRCLMFGTPHQVVKKFDFIAKMADKGK